MGALGARTAEKSGLGCLAGMDGIKPSPNRLGFCLGLLSGCGVQFSVRVSKEFDLERHNLGNVKLGRL